MDKLRVLTVDDEEGMRLAIRRSLATFEMELPEMDGPVALDVFDAGTAEEGLELVRERRPHILLLDQKLPGMSGTEMMSELQELPEQPLVVMITAYATIETAIQATKKGAYDFLPKPFTPEELRNTLRKAAEHVVVTEQARKLAEERKQVRFQFLSVLAHELKAPLNAVQGFIDILKDQGETLSKEDIDTILDRGSIRLHYMRKMIDDLLDLTRIESGQKKRELGKTDVVAAARSAIETATPDADERGVQIKLHAPEHLKMTADRSEMEIILNNLVSNAVKYNRDDGRVDVTLESDETTVTIVVADTGIGMTQEEADTLFHDFVRIKNEKTRKIPGSGLGLSIVKKIAQMYSGDVSVESEPDKGSTFTVHLRRTQE